MTPVLAAAEKNIKIAVDVKPDQGFRNIIFSAALLRKGFGAKRLRVK